MNPLSIHAAEGQSLHPLCSACMSVFAPTEPTDFPVLLDVGAAPTQWFYDSFRGGNWAVSPSNEEAVLLT